MLSRSSHKIERLGFAEFRESSAGFTGQQSHLDDADQRNCTNLSVPSVNDVSEINMSVHPEPLIQSFAHITNAPDGVSRSSARPQSEEGNSSDVSKSWTSRSAGGSIPAQ